MYREVWSEILQIGADFQMTFPVAGYIVKFFLQNLTSWDVLTHSFTAFFWAKRYAIL